MAVIDSRTFSLFSAFGREKGWIYFHTKVHCLDNNFPILVIQPSAVAQEKLHLGLQLKVHLDINLLSFVQMYTPVKNLHLTQRKGVKETA